MSSDILDALRRAAGSQRRDINTSEILNRGERLRARHRFLVVAVGAVLAVGVLGVFPTLLSLFDGGPEEGVPAVSDAQEPSPSPIDGTEDPTPSRGERCDFPDLRPTYLPWLTPDEDIPKPEAAHLEHEDSSGEKVADSAYLDWTSRSIGVTLSLEDELRGGPGSPAEVTLMGTDGYVYTGPDPGEASILWDLPDEPCNLLSLHLRAADGVFTTAEAIDEVINVAESLRP